MKRNFCLLILLILTICLVSFALDQIIPANIVQAASETHPQLSSASPFDQETIPITSSAPPVVTIIIGSVGVLFGIIALSPLLIGDPKRVLDEVDQAEK